MEMEKAKAGGEGRREKGGKGRGGLVAPRAVREIAADTRGATTHTHTHTARR